MTPLQRCGRFGRAIMESVLIFAFRGLPSAVMKGLRSAAGWIGSRIQKPGMATVNAVAAKVESGTRAGTTT
jgi:hypothetical protein